ncbi:hypothetical protein AWC02_02225 [Mycolicibacter engbaekii]|uniref:Acid stress chaperone HdeA n=1 Tax=Mycolicibacter engbaekii TaxID=188915 RepID=A0A1X1U7Z3_9MYCO|nr:hypothetical protein [Mycolicibacter engbaekii]ORV52941.1 hypothetical protein AWC02_02225 [Mycolicibacter engbaekii]
MMKNVALAALALGVMFSGACSASEVINTGGDTRCKDFVDHDEKKQDDEITKMLKDRSGTDPATLEVSATRLSVSTYCKTLGKPDSKISEAPHG